MLQTVRKYTQGWVATVMGLLLTFAFVMWGIENYLSGSNKKNLVAKINGTEIHSAQLNAGYQRMLLHVKDQLGAQFSLTPIMQEQLKVQTLNNLITETVLSQSAVKSGFRVTNMETATMVKQMPVFQENGQFSKSRFEVIVPRMGYTRDEFFADVSQTLLLNQVASGIIGSSFVLPNELKQAVSLVEQKRTIAFAIIPSNQFKKDILVSDNDIKKYFDDHQNDFKLPAKLQLEYVALSIDDLKKTIKVTDDELTEFVENNGVNKNDSKAVTSAKENIQQQKAEQAFLAASDKLTELAYANPDSLDSPAKDLNLKIQNSEYFTQKGGSSTLTKNQQVIANAFNGELLKNHSNSNLIEISPGHVVIIRIKDYQAETVQALDAVKEGIKQKLTTLNEIAATKTRGEQLLAEIKTPADFDKIAQANHLKVVNKQNLSRQDKSISAEVAQQAFNINPQSAKKIAGAQLANGDYVLVSLLSSVDLAADKMTDKQRQNMTKIYSDTYGKLEYNLYVENQMDKAKVKILSKPNTPQTITP